MKQFDGYLAIVRAISRDPEKQLIDHWFDEDNFGNFYIGYSVSEQKRSIICEKGQIMSCSDLLQEGNCSVIHEWLGYVDEQVLLHSLNLQ
ncbi:MULTISPECIES: hypothetical protein [Sphingomonas]|uniref:hypothetical protein n=1 Tax=Sphingomonas TaxID=13687 RepID=UPI000DEF659A|nr:MULTISPECIES: hypothetical protein [Sphingomonas]